MTKPSEPTNLPAFLKIVSTCFCLLLLLRPEVMADKPNVFFIADDVSQDDFLTQPLDPHSN